MTYQAKIVRSGLTAIAAVLALSSTPLAAQETTTPPDPAVEPVSEPPSTADPLAPEPTEPEPAAAETTTAKVAPSETTTTTTATTRRTATRTRAAATTTRRAPAPAEQASSGAPATMPASEATAEMMPTPPPSTASVEPGPMPVAEPVAETTAMPADDALPIAGAAGLGLLALGGIGIAVGHRRRRKQELAHDVANRQYLDSHPDADTPVSDTPAFARTAPPAMAAAAPVHTDVPRTKLPAGFDLSRFGPHVRAAYQGPTADNPSLSLKHRLRRAAALDQQARVHGEAPREAVVAAAARKDPATKPMWIKNEGFMIRRAGSAQSSKPAFQH